MRGVREVRVLVHHQPGPEDRGGRHRREEARAAGAAARKRARQTGGSEDDDGHEDGDATEHDMSVGDGDAAKERSRRGHTHTHTGTMWPRLARFRTKRVGGTTGYSCPPGTRMTLATDVICVAAFTSSRIQGYGQIRM